MHSPASTARPPTTQGSPPGAPGEGPPGGGVGPHRWGAGASAAILPDEAGRGTGRVRGHGRRATAPRRPLDIFAPDLFAGRVALVTGGGTGIGRQTALGFARYGADVVLAGPHAPRRSSHRGGGRDRGARRVLVVPTNIRDSDQVDALRDRAYERFGRVDFLVNNAGGQFPALPSQISDNGWRAVVDLNLQRHVEHGQPVHGADDRGRLRRRSSTSSTSSRSTGARPSFVHSGAARAGVVSLTRSMAPYLGYHGVTINALAPGTIGTAGHARERGRASSATTRRRGPWRSRPIGPMRRMATAEEMAAIVLFLCSPAARFVNGAAIVADGRESQSNWPRFFARGEL